MKVSEILARANLQPVSKGRMSRIGWADGYLVVEYPGTKNSGPSLYVYGPNAAECERDKLLRVPYPDNTLNQLKAKHNWQSMKVK